MRAKRIRFTGLGEASYEEFEVDRPDEDQILVETLYSAVSPGTERALILAKAGTVTAARGFPFQPGYSSVGQIIEIGRRVTSFEVGQLVATQQPHVNHTLLPATVGPGRLSEKYRDQFRSPIAVGAAFAPLHYIGLWPMDSIPTN